MQERLCPAEQKSHREALTNRNKNRGRKESHVSRQRDRVLSFLYEEDPSLR